MAGEVLPSLKAAQTVVTQIEQSLQRIDQLTGSIASKSSAFADLGSSGTGASNAFTINPNRIINGHVAGPGYQINNPAMGAAWQFSNPMNAGLAPTNPMMTAATAVRQQGNSAMVRSTAGWTAPPWTANPAGGGGPVGGGTGGVLGRAAAIGGIAAGFDYMTGANTGTITSSDILYSQIARTQGLAGTPYQRNVLPGALNSAFRGGFTSSADLMSAAQTLYNTGGTASSIVGAGPSVAAFAAAGGMSAQESAGAVGNLAQPRNQALLRMYGIPGVVNQRTGQMTGDITGTVQSIYQKVFAGYNPSPDDISAAFAPGGHMAASLQNLGFDQSQINAARNISAMMQSNGGKTLSNAQVKSIGNQSLYGSSANRAATADQRQAETFGSLAGGLDSANKAASDLSNTFSLLNQTVGQAVQYMRGGLSGAGQSPFGGGSNGFGSVVGKVSDSAQNLLLEGLALKGLKGGASAGGLGRLGGLAGGRLLGGLGVGALGTVGGGLGSMAGGAATHGSKWGKIGGGIAGGAAAGAAAGLMGGPFAEITSPVGAAIGGLVGGLGALFGGPDDQLHGLTRMDPGTDLNGPKGDTISQIMAMASGLPGQYRITSAFRPGGNSLHAKGDAVDFSTPNPSVDSAGLLAINHYFASKYGSELSELIYAGPGGINIKNGKRVDGASFYGAQTMSQHHNHVHVGVTPDRLGIKATGVGGTSTTSGTSGGGGNSYGGLTTSALAARASAMLITDPNGAASVNFNGLTGANTVGSSRGATSSNSAPGGAMPSGNLASWEHTALKLLGLDYNTYAGGLTNIITHESGGNPKAINLTDSNARAGHPSKGLMQTIDSTFSSHAMAGHKDIWNPVDNILAGVRYIEADYGLKMLKAGGNRNSAGQYIGYAHGSYNITSDQVATVHQGEMVLPTRIASAVRDALQNNKGSGHGGCNVQITVMLQNASNAEAQRFAAQVKSIMDSDNHTSLVGST